LSTDKPEGATRIIERPGQDPVLVVRRSTLTVTRGPDKGRTVELDEGRPLTVGSDGALCDLALTDPAVSSRHFSIEPDSAGFLLRDRESTNGTRVDGYRVAGIYLPRGAQIDAGDTRLKFAAAKEEVELPLSSKTRLGELLGHSDTMRRVFAIIERVAATDTTILIEGESGTGKELAARALHDASPRRDAGMFVAVDCGALPATLIESELFGHAKGAFTGADSAKVGLFEEASGGTLFLDEVGELPLDLQPKLLRALETRSVRRLGEAAPRPVDVRLLAATNRKLNHEVASKRFREDLFFRLSVIRVRMPPLRERREEIPRLVAHFTTLLGHDPATAPMPETIRELLLDYRWPGNVRELRNVVERLVLLPGMQPDFYLDPDPDGATGAKSDDDDGARPQVSLELPFHEGKRQWTERYEREYLGRSLRRCNGNISELARVSGLSRQSCHRLLKRHGLES
jgi:DNA-binding NtrC family response regulator